jgi:Ran GTPase-activating protein (RanGAP) involved in mRNA processing and transport
LQNFDLSCKNKENLKIKDNDADFSKNLDFIHGLSQSKSLRVLDLSSIELGSKGLEILSTALANYSSIEKLTLTGKFQIEFYK